ncbi:hypothetical protein GCM10009765_40750 [Fodinicola feengrottensis]|uniref:DUF1232 domain-containing protein n=1 Tax=Fodinicola feengrottensis TaxID=435914 RepID=A0ABN2HFH0_9ACTN
MSTWDWVGLSVLAVAVLATCAIVIWLVFKMIRKYRTITQPGMPISAKITFFASIAYAIFPLDLLPDPIYLDDIAVMVGALAYIGHCAKKLADRPAELPVALPTRRS